jgi:hypothetical protein
MKWFVLGFVRLAAFIGRQYQNPGRSRLAVLSYWLAGVAVKAGGGRLTSRIATFRHLSPEDSELEDTISALTEYLRQFGIGAEIKRTLLERDQANTHPDTTDMYPAGLSSGPETVSLLEVFVPTYQYWKAGELAGEFLEPLRVGSGQAGNKIV